MKRSYPKELEGFIREKYKIYTARQITPLINEEFGIKMTPQQVHNYIMNHGIKCGVRGKPMPEARKFSPEVDEFILDNYKGRGYKAMADMVNSEFGTEYTADQIKNYYGRHKLNSGLTGRFEKGHVSHNKGKHIKTTGRMAETQFKKGHIPKNHKPVGTESIRSSKGRKYIYVKVAEPKTWREKHILEWEKHNGPVPEGKIIIFADGDTMNTDVSNLVCISKRQNSVMNRHKIRGSDKETMVAAANVASLKLKIAESKRKAKGKR